MASIEIVQQRASDEAILKRDLDEFLNTQPKGSKRASDGTENNGHDDAYSARVVREQPGAYCPGFFHKAETAGAK
jgi:hypothetical protein